MNRLERSELLIPKASPESRQSNGVSDGLQRDAPLVEVPCNRPVPAAGFLRGVWGEGVEPEDFFEKVVPSHERGFERLALLARLRARDRAASFDSFRR